MVTDAQIEAAMVVAVVKGADSGFRCGGCASGVGRWVVDGESVLCNGCLMRRLNDMYSAALGYVMRDRDRGRGLREELGASAPPFGKGRVMP